MSGITLYTNILVYLLLFDGDILAVVKFYRRLFLFTSIKVLVSIRIKQK
jgi:hypothetical protein